MERKTVINMIEKIRSYIDKIFADVPKTRKNWELKEELIGNLQERFQDLLAGGMSEAEAYEHAIESLGNVNELIGSLQNGAESSADDEKSRKKRAFYNTIAVGLYVFSGAVFFIFAALSESLATTIDLSLVGLVVTLLICIIPICINVYTSYAYPRYRKSDDTVVEEFKEWQSEKDKNKEIKKSINSIVWMLTIILYFIISFTTGAWHITWVIYLIAVCVDQIVNLVFSLRQ